MTKCIPPTLIEEERRMSRHMGPRWRRWLRGLRYGYLRTGLVTWVVPVEFEFAGRVLMRKTYEVEAYSAVEAWDKVMALMEAESA